MDRMGGCKGAAEPGNNVSKIPTSPRVRRLKVKIADSLTIATASQMLMVPIALQDHTHHISTGMAEALVERNILLDLLHHGFQQVTPTEKQRFCHGGLEFIMLHSRPIPTDCCVSTWPMGTMPP